MENSLIETYEAYKAGYIAFRAEMEVRRREWNSNIGQFQTCTLSRFMLPLILTQIAGKISYAVRKWDYQTGVLIRARKRREELAGEVSYICLISLSFTLISKSTCKVYKCREMTRMLARWSRHTGLALQSAHVAIEATYSYFQSRRHYHSWRFYFRYVTLMREIRLRRRMRRWQRVAKRGRTRAEKRREGYGVADRHMQKKMRMDAVCAIDVWRREVALSYERRDRDMEGAMHRMKVKQRTHTSHLPDLSYDLSYT